METNSIFENFSSERIIEFAKKNYKTYVKHYRDRNQKPMPLDEFLKNYAGNF